MTLGLAMRTADADWYHRQVGRVIAGRWTLESLLEFGGTAAVFLATHRNGSRVAIKLFRPGPDAGSRLRDRFSREPYAANRVGHPRVVRVFDDGEEADGSLYLVMELLAGEPLDELAQRLGGRLPWPQVVEMCLQLLDVLERAHDRGIVHRDIKPSNLFWSANEGLRVLDFGLARVEDGSGERTQDGAVIGTPSFMSPEQARAATQLVGSASDIWSVAATAFTLLSGRRVYEAPTADERLALAAASPPPNLDERLPDVPPAVRGVLQRALEYEPYRRWPSAAAMQRALNDALAGHRARTADEASGEVTLTEDAEQPSTPTGATRVRWKPLVATVGVVSTVAVAWVLTQSTPSPRVHPVSAAGPTSDSGDMKPERSAAEPLPAVGRAARGKPLADAAAPPTSRSHPLPSQSASRNMLPPESSAAQRPRPTTRPTGAALATLPTPEGLIEQPPF